MNELKWLTKLILKDLKLGIGHEKILQMYHPNCLVLFNTTSDLRSAFTKISQYESNLGVFKMFIPIKPMLSGKPNLQQIAEFIRMKVEVIVETKFDGERI